MIEKEKSPWWQPSLVIFVRLSSWIVGPILVAILIGKWLDKKYGTDPWLFLLSVGIAFVVSMFGVVRNATREMEKIDKEKSEVKNQSEKDKK